MEYTLLMAGAVALSIVALRQGGLLEKTVDESLDKSVSAVECMALNTCYDPQGCPATCGNGCCETHAETAGSCWRTARVQTPRRAMTGGIATGGKNAGGMSIAGTGIR